MLTCPKCGLIYRKNVEHCSLDGTHLVKSDTDPMIGKKIDRYQISGLIGDGGMARVYRATHSFLDQECAVKVIYGDFAADRDLAKRFQREAKALSRIKHPNIVEVKDFGVTDQGLIFMAMELLEGRTLTQLLQQDAPLQPGRVAQLTLQIAAGLGAAHAKGYVHRDLKPGNVIVVEEQGFEVPKILDFGLVRLIVQTEESTQLTAQGQFFGTPAYMSPEQITGGEIGPAADLYSLGVMVYQMLVGMTPFTGDISELTLQHVSKPPPKLPLPYSGLGPLALSLLEKDPADRPASATEVIQLIDSCQITMPPGAPIHRPRTPLLRRLSGEGLRPPPPPVAKPVPEDDSVDESLEVAIDDAKSRWPYLLAVVAAGGALAFALSESDRFGNSSGDEKPTIATIDPPQPTVVDAAVPSPVKKTKPKRKPKKKKKKVTPKKVVDAGFVSVDSGVEETPEPVVPPGEERSHKELDHGLAWSLSQRGLNWQDLIEVDRNNTRKWARWFRQQKTPAQKELVSTYEALRASIADIEVTADFLLQKRRRAKNTLNKVPRAERDDRYEILSKRCDDLKQEIKRITPDRAKHVASQVTLFESEAAGFLAEAKARAKARAEAEAKKAAEEAATSTIGN